MTPTQPTATTTEALIEALRSVATSARQGAAYWNHPSTALSFIDIANIAEAALSMSHAADPSPSASLAAELEQAKASRDNWKESHGRVVEGFAEVCEAIGVQFDAPEAVAYAINAKISNAEYDKRAAETELSALRALLDSIIARDDRNGSLPEWYRHEIDAVYASRAISQGGEERS